MLCGASPALSADLIDTGAQQAGKAIDPEDAPAITRYAVQLEGVGPELAQFLTSLSQTETQKNSPVASQGLLRKRGEDDAETFKKALIARGHLNATVEVTVLAEAQPPVLRFQIAPGPVYILTKAEVELADQPANLAGTNATSAFPPFAELGLAVGGPFQAKAVLDVQGKLVAHLKRTGYPYATAAKPLVMASTEAPTVRVVYSLTAGPKATFGATRFEGLTTVKTSFLEDEPLWKPGDPYNHDLLRELETRLARLNLFGAVGALPADTPNADGSVDIIVTLGERKHRTIKAGAAYKTDVGPSISLGWEHRNLMGAGERVAITLEAALLESKAVVEFDKPKFLRPDQALRTSLEVKTEDTSAYEADSLTAKAMVERQLSPRWKAAAGLAFREADVLRDEARPEQDELKYSLVSAPMTLSFDSRDSVLDPTRGVLASFLAEPFYSVGESTMSSDAFLKLEGQARGFLMLLEKPRLILAGRGTLGGYLGLPGEELPPVLRYYTGGGGSVRGYKYQTAGPMRGDNPLGGSYLTEVSMEMRLRITEELGFVPFVDGGNVFDSWDDLNDGLLWAGGLGLRYATPIGPLRLDVAFPFDPRSSDDTFQVYVSVGQAF
ncbi:autotransporter assembly complex family protein [Megalodesulfovibrio paquesii]